MRLFSARSKNSNTIVAVDLRNTGKAAGFLSVLNKHGFRSFERWGIRTLQINVGKVCNQACHHCHVDAGPKRTESMLCHTVDRVLDVLKRSSSVGTVDITGGAPEINPNFRRLVSRCRESGRNVIDRCNLTILLERGFESLPEFLAEYGVNITASLPCYTAPNVDQQRGRGVFDKSIAALRRLNRLGYGMPESQLRLDLVYNPVGPSLPPPQEALEQDYKQQLREQFGIEFHRLLTLTNMPINRFADTLRRTGQAARYQELLVQHFNPGTISKVMCRSLVSVGWDGRLYDCDFNQMLEMRMPMQPTVWDIDSFEELSGRPISTGPHCFGCTAGAGSSCGGALQ